MLIELHDRLAGHAFQPASITLHFELSIMKGTRAMSGRRDQLQERRHGIFGVEQAFVHVDVDDLRAVLDLVAATSTAAA
jgi:hypothetical protein